MKYRITTWLAAALMLSSLHATAASLSDIQVSNGDQQARITLSFVGEPEYSFTPQGKRLVALDIKQTGVLQGLPLQFSGSNLVKSIRAGTPQDTQTLRLLVDLTEDGKTRAVKQQNGANYTVVFTINADAPPPPPPPPVVVKRADPPPVMPSRTTTSGRNHGPGADVMLNIDWHPGMIGQRFAERDIFNILIKRHAMNNAIFGIDNTGHRHGDGGKAFQLLLMANKEAINMVDNARQKRRAVGERQLQLILHHQLTA